MCTTHSQVGVTRFNMDGSGSNYSVSTSNSPMMNRDVQPFNQGEFGSQMVHLLMFAQATERFNYFHHPHAAPIDRAKAKM